jgi:O-antigen/teichoic acid export membrane protein
VLDVLGATDYGINNIITGVVVLFSFLNNALLSATQRFLNFYLGKKDYDTTETVFCMSMNTYLLFSVIVLIIGETVGLWFVQTQLNIPIERMNVAVWVYQLALIQFITSLLRIPYNATIIAYERMGFYAYVSLVEVLLKLGCVYLLYITTFDKLLVYSILYTIIPIIINLAYKTFCNHNFKTSFYRIIWDKSIFKELFGFTGWSLFGSVANLLAQQGLNILLNIFHGVTVNAAAGIANQVSTSVFGFVSNFQTAFQPQIVKTYASGEHNRFFQLIMQTSKFSFFLVLMIFTPIILTIDHILAIWLKDVPEYTGIFCQLILVYLALEALSAPLWMGVQATGKIRNYQILIAVIIGLNFPLAYLYLKLGYPPYCVWWIRIGINIVTLIVRCIYMKYNLCFSIILYLKKVIYPILGVTLFSIIIPCWIDHVLQQSAFNFVLVVASSVVISIVLIYFIGMSSSEKKIVKKMIEIMIRNKLLAVSTEAEINIGDYIQALASSQYYPTIDGFVEREKLLEYKGEKTNVIMNGWYMHHPEQWPPTDKITPLFVAFHINILAKDALLSEKSINYLKRHEPIGCRDEWTATLLRDKGVKAYFSACMTLTLGKRFKNKAKDAGKVYFVDLAYSYNKIQVIPLLFTLLFNFFRISRMLTTLYDKNKSKLKNYLAAAAILREYSRVFSKDVITNAEYICQQSSAYNQKYKSNSELLDCAESLIKKYAKAEFVVTSRIHCALPCLGLETPVLYTFAKDQIEASTCRMNGLMDLFTVVFENHGRLEPSFELNKKISRKEDFPTNKPLWKKYAQDLDKECTLFMNENN